MNKSSDESSLTPLIIDLPQDSADYFEILGKTKAVTMRSGFVTLKPGQEVGSHNTDNYEELIVMLEGSGEVETQGVGRRPIAKGQAAYNPPYTQHNVINNGSAPMKYIYIVARAFE
jgi:quercetin dioxygenase-like cupin family protein